MNGCTKCVADIILGRGGATVPYPGASQQYEARTWSCGILFLCSPYPRADRHYKHPERLWLSCQSPQLDPPVLVSYPLWKNMVLTRKMFAAWRSSVKSECASQFQALDIPPWTLQTYSGASLCVFNLRRGQGWSLQNVAAWIWNLLSDVPSWFLSPPWNIIDSITLFLRPNLISISYIRNNVGLFFFGGKSRQPLQMRCGWSFRL